MSFWATSIDPRGMYLINGVRQPLDLTPLWAVLTELLKQLPHLAPLTSLQKCLFMIKIIKP